MGQWVWLIVGLGLSGAVAAELPEAVVRDPRYQLGYLVVTAYPGVTADGTGNCAPGIQQAIDDAYRLQRVVFFPPGVYQIAETLKCYRRQEWNPDKNRPFNPKDENHLLVGSTRGAARPLLKLAAHAPAFDDPTRPRPLLAYRSFRILGPDSPPFVDPVDPLGNPPGYEDMSPNLFGDELRGIDLDCSGHPGAIGVVFAAAQSSTVENVRIEATGATAGFKGLPGRNSGGAGIEVRGGRIGLWLDGGMAEPTVVGATLIGQTERAVVYQDFTPLVMVGFKIVKETGPVIGTEELSWSSGGGTMSLVDGTIELQGGPAIDNRAGKNLYLRNITVSGADSLIQRRGQPDLTSTGPRQRIVEYAYCDQRSPADAGQYTTASRHFRSYTCVDGLVGRTAEPVVVLEPNAPAPPDCVARHLWSTLPSFEGEADGTLVVTAPPYAARPDDESDDRPALQAAIDAASAAGHGRVFVPAGTYQLGGPLTLRANTILFGAGRRATRLSFHPSWRPTEGQPVLVETVDDPGASCCLAFLSLHIPCEGTTVLPSGAYDTDRFGHLHWRAGRRSMTVGLEFEHQWIGLGITGQRTVARFSGGGGGRHWFLEPNSLSGSPDFRCVRLDGTTEPLSFYGLNLEATKKAKLISTACLEAIGARNVRIYGIKREGVSPSLVLRDCHNFALFSSGCMRTPVAQGLGGYVQILGASDGIVLANLNTQRVEAPPNGEVMLREALAGQPELTVPWPDNVAYYRRGALDDAAMGW